MKIINRTMKISPFIALLAVVAACCSPLIQGAQVSDLPETTSAAATDYVLIDTLQSGIYRSRKITVGNLGLTIPNLVRTNGTYSDPAWLTGIDWSKILNRPTTLAGFGIVDAQPLDADLSDLADGSLTGSKVGSGINAANITVGTIANARLASALENIAENSGTVSLAGTTLILPTIGHHFEVETDDILAMTVKSSAENGVAMQILQDGTGTTGGLGIATTSPNSMVFGVTAFSDAFAGTLISMHVDTNQVASFDHTGKLTTVSSVQADSGFITDATVQTAGLIVREDGAGPTMGQVTLDDGEATVTTTAVTYGSRIFLSRQSKGSSVAIGHLTVGSIGELTNFQIQALKADGNVETNDESVVNWIIITPTPLP